MHPTQTVHFLSTQSTLGRPRRLIQDSVQYPSSQASKLQRLNELRRAYGFDCEPKTFPVSFSTLPIAFAVAVSSPLGIRLTLCVIRLTHCCWNRKTGRDWKTNRCHFSEIRTLSPEQFLLGCVPLRLYSRPQQYVIFGILRSAFFGLPFQ